ncbi:MAG: hypothetical protein SFY66_02460 [Oculatellaceae cyanobacterium bins.114]|nr:hypothetical protein [Oculatellaceae cyanobacterium bins.114]
MGRKAVWIGSTIAFVGIVSFGLWLFSNLFVIDESSGTEAIAEFQHLTKTPAEAMSALSASNAHFLIEGWGIDSSFFFRFQTNQDFINTFVAQHQLELTPNEARPCQNIVAHGPMRLWWNVWIHPSSQCYISYEGDLYHLLFDPKSGTMFLYIVD